MTTAAVPHMQAFSAMSGGGAAACRRRLSLPGEGFGGRTERRCLAWPVLLHPGAMPCVTLPPGHLRPLHTRPPPALAYPLQTR